MVTRGVGLAVGTFAPGGGPSLGVGCRALLLLALPMGWSRQITSLGGV